MIVVDASVIVEVLLDTAVANSFESRLFDPAESLHAPHLLDVEVVQVLRRLVAMGELDAGRGGAAIFDLVDLPVTRYPHETVLPRVWELRHNISAYDAVYVALAEALGATLFTRDRRLASAADRYVPVDLP